MRQTPWRTVALAAALLTALTWSGVSGWWVSQSWTHRDVMARVELAREEIACGNRSASPANQQRCRDLAVLVNSAEVAEAYFIDGVVVFGPALLFVGLAFWLRRRGGHRDGRNHPGPHHHRRPSAA